MTNWCITARFRMARLLILHGRSNILMRDSLLYVACLLVMTAPLSFVGGMAWQERVFLGSCRDQGRELVATHQLKSGLYCTWKDADGAIRKEKAK